MVRLPDVPAEERILLMEKILTDHSPELSKQSIITVSGDRIRISRPPE